jgi:hypothetical protein
VVVSGILSANASAAGACKASITLPVPSDFQDVYDCNGVSLNFSGVISADATNNVANVDWFVSGSGSVTLRFQLMYTIRSDG